MELIAQLDIESWAGPFHDAVTSRAADALEHGRILVVPRLHFALLENERRFLSEDCLDAKSKNISFRPASGTLHGTRCEGADREALLAMLRRYYEKSRGWISALCPAYGPHLIDGFTSFRPAEIAGRTSSWRKDDTRLHVDAFPSRPVQGRRILRVFTNVNSTSPREWRVGEDFEKMASALLPHIKPPFPGSAWLLRQARIVKGRRTPYDHYMLGLHDGMKADLAYQSRAKQADLSIPAGATWSCFTDSVSHAAISGQFAFEQTFYLPMEAMQKPALAPLKILERLTGRALI